MRNRSHNQSHSQQAGDQKCLKNLDLLFRGWLRNEATSFFYYRETPSECYNQKTMTTYKGQLEGFPIEVVEKMLHYQVEQGNKRDVTIFEANKLAAKCQQGFEWTDTPENQDFWSHVIDKKNFIRYKNVKGEFGKKLNKGIKLNREDKNEKAYGMMTLENNRCSFLNNENYCDIYINKGEDYLCNTCKVYPRMITKNGPIYQRGLNLSCPEVAKKLVECDKSFDFYLEDEKLSPLDYHYIVEVPYNEEMYNLLWEGRGFSIEIAQFREIKLWKRLVFIKLVEEKLQNLEK